MTNSIIMMTGNRLFQISITSVTASIHNKDRKLLIPIPGKMPRNWGHGCNHAYRHRAMHVIFFSVEKDTNIFFYIFFRAIDFSNPWWTDRMTRHKDLLYCSRLETWITDSILFLIAWLDNNYIERRLAHSTYGTVFAVLALREFKTGHRPTLWR